MEDDEGYFLDTFGEGEPELCSSNLSYASSYFRHPSYFSITQLTDLLDSASSTNLTKQARQASIANGAGTATAHPTKANGKREGKEPPGLASNLSSASLPAPPLAQQRSSPASSVAFHGSRPGFLPAAAQASDSANSIANFGRDFLAQSERRARTAPSVASNSFCSYPIFTSARNLTKPLNGADDSSRPFVMPAIAGSGAHQDEPAAQHLQQHRKSAPAKVPARVQSTSLGSNVSSTNSRREKRPVLTEPAVAGATVDREARPRGNGWAYKSDPQLDLPSQNGTATAEPTASPANETTLRNGRITEPHKPLLSSPSAAVATARAKARRHSTGDTSTSGSGPLLGQDEGGDCASAAASRVHFYDIDSDTLSPKHAQQQLNIGSSVATSQEPSKPSRPVMRAASITWDDDDDHVQTGQQTKSNGREAKPSPKSNMTTISPSVPMQAASSMNTVGGVDAEHHVETIIVRAKSTQKPAAVRPPPLDAHQQPPSPVCEDTPPVMLCPIAEPSSAFEATRSASHTPMKATNSRASGNNLVADEVVYVSYESGEAVHKSLTVGALQAHFLSGHNAMLTIANTPQCTALAEDAVSTMLQSVYAQSQHMGDGIRNELSLYAHAVYPEGCVYNLLPTTTDEQEKSEIRIGTNPVMGTCVVNNPPVQMRSREEVLFVSRGLIQNARHLHADPYSDPRAFVHVTVLLRQTRSAGVHLSHMSNTTDGSSLSELQKSVTRHATSGSAPTSASRDGLEADLNQHVYLSSLQILWVGSNYDVVHHTLTEKPVNLWSLYRQPFGGQCCTAVMAFVDHRDDLAYSTNTLEFAAYMRGFVNRPPRSGSVVKFLLSTEQTGRDELDRNIFSLEMMRQDAMRLLSDPTAQPSLYMVMPRNEIPPQPYVSASRVVLMQTADSEGDGARETANGLRNTKRSSRNNTAKNATVTTPQEAAAAAAAAAAAHYPDAPQQQWSTSSTSSPASTQTHSRHKAAATRSPPHRESVNKPGSMCSSVAEVSIGLPSFLKTQEGAPLTVPRPPPTETATSNAAAPSPPQRGAKSALPPQQERQQQPLSHIPQPPLQLAPTNPSDSTLHSASSGHPSLNEGRVRPGRLRDRAVASSVKPMSFSGSNLRGIGIGTGTASGTDEPPSTASGYGDCIKTNLLLFPGVWDVAQRRSTSPTSALMPQRRSPEVPMSPSLPLSVQDDKTVILYVPESPAKPKGGSVPLTFEVDEVHPAEYHESTQTYNILRNFGALRDVYATFVEEQNSIALLCTHAGAVVRPFQQMPIWEVAGRIMLDAMDANMKLPTPSQFTVFGSILKNTTIVRDLAEVGSPEVERPVDGQEALVGASPLFGSILYQTRGVDLFDTSEVQPVLQSMLKYADDAASNDPEVYMVVTAVRKTTQALDPADAPDQLPEYHWDASFSACTIVLTRNNVEVFQNAVADMNAVVAPSSPAYPFGLLSEIIGGSCKSVSFLTLETGNTPLPVAHRALTMQKTLGEVQNEAMRSNRVSVYVQSCLNAAQAVRELLGRHHRALMLGQAPKQELSPEDEALLQAHASKLDALAEQHAEYLMNADIRGFVIYPTPSMEDMQTLFFNSFRYNTTLPASSGKMRQLPVASGPPPPEPQPQRKTLVPSPSSLPSPPSLDGMQQSADAPTTQEEDAEVHQRLAGTPTTANENPLHTAATLSNTTVATAVHPEAPSALETGFLPPPQAVPPQRSSASRPVSAVALSRDSGIVAHSMLLLSQDDSPANTADAPGEPICEITASRTNEVSVNFGDQHTSVYSFDEVVRVVASGKSHKAKLVSPSQNYAVLHKSPLLHDAVAGCLAGYNATLVFQETAAAQARGVCEGLCQHVFRSAVASCPPEAAFFVSAGYLDEHSAMDLLDPHAVRAATAIANPISHGNEDTHAQIRGQRLAPMLGKSLLTGTFLATAQLQAVQTSHDVSDALRRAFQADAAISAADAAELGYDDHEDNDVNGGRAAVVSPHFMVLSLWQKLYVSAEQDVCLSSMLIILTRGGPRLLQEALERSSNDAIAQLLDYALRGSCYTICGCSMTDTEPQPLASSSAAPTAAQLQPALNFYQNNLNAYTGKALRYNSVMDALKVHRKELAKAVALFSALEQRVQQGGGEAALTEQEKYERMTTNFAVRHLTKMIADEEALLQEGLRTLRTVPPFYTIMSLQ